jgi:hypothetical protein
MKATVDRLSAELAGKYIHYLEAFTAEFESVPDAIEFRCSFALNSDRQIRHFKMRVPALPGDTEGERDLIILMIFEGMEAIIDGLITADGAATN